MKQLVRYTGEEARAQALKDAKEWLGPARYEVLRKAVEEGQIRGRSQLRFYCAFAGMEGFPVKVLADEWRMGEEEKEDEF